VDWAEHAFEEGMLYVRVRFTDQTELCWVLQTAHVILEADLSDWTTGNCKQLIPYVQGESAIGSDGWSHMVLPFILRHSRVCVSPHCFVQCVKDEIGLPSQEFGNR
jgi:hypothetical protein